MASSSSKEDEPKTPFPLDSDSYKVVDDIGVGVGAVVYKAECIPLDSTVVAIKAIDLDHSKVDFDSIRRETKIMTLLSHPNILNAHCCFIVDRRLWVVMPFMSGGSLQSIISSSFPDGLPEECISIVLKETLKGLSYLHNQGHFHGDIKAGNILMHSDGCVKLANFGVSASVNELSSSSRPGSSTSSSSTNTMLIDVAAPQYWVAPEMIYCQTEFSFKADIWYFGITALELAHGKPPLSHLPPSKSLIKKITERFPFSVNESSSTSNEEKSNNFSKAFKDMVASCLDQDPAKRLSAEELSEHSFFESCKGSAFLVKHLLHGLPSVEERFGACKSAAVEVDDADVDGEQSGSQLSGWNFNKDGLVLEPVFPFESEDDFIVKMVRFGGETIIPDRAGSSNSSGDIGGSNLNTPAAESGLMSSPREVGDGGNDNSHGEEISGIVQGIEGNESGVNIPNFNEDKVMDGLMQLIDSLEEQRQNLTHLLNMVGGDVLTNTIEDHLMQTIESLQNELEAEREKNLALRMELEFLKLTISGASNTDESD